MYRWRKFGNSSISMREVITNSILEGFDQKNHFFWEVIFVQVQWFGTGTRYKLEILQQRGKRVKTKSQKVLEANSYVCRSYRRKTFSILYTAVTPCQRSCQHTMHQLPIILENHQLYQNNKFSQFSTFMLL